MKVAGCFKMEKGNGKKEKEMKRKIYKDFIRFLQEYLY